MVSEGFSDKKNCNAGIPSWRLISLKFPQEAIPALQFFFARKQIVMQKSLLEPRRDFCITIFFWSPKNCNAEIPSWGWAWLGWVFPKKIVMQESLLGSRRDFCITIFFRAPKNCNAGIPSWLSFWLKKGFLHYNLF